MPPVFPDDFERRNPQQRANDVQHRQQQVDGLNAQIQGGEEWPPDWLVDQIQELLGLRPPPNSEHGQDDPPEPASIELAGTPEGLRIVSRRLLLVARDQEFFDPAGDFLQGERFELIGPGDHCAELDEVYALFQATAGSTYDTIAAMLAELRRRFPGIVAQDVSVGVMHTVIKSDDRPVATTVEPVIQAPLGPPPGHPPVVAVIDTGITEDLRDDDLLDEVDRSADNLDALDLIPMDGLLDFGAGHGTFVAGVVRQVSAHCEIRVYRALDTQGFGTETAVACAIVRAVAEGADVVCLSLGVQNDAGNPLAFEAALDWIDRNYPRRRKPVVVASAGNFGSTTEVWPAASPRVTAVAALTAADEDDPPEGATWSSRGCWVDCSAVGEGIVSTFVELPPGPGDPWAIWSGTSFAAPQVAGAIARLMIEEDGLTAVQARDRLLGPVAGWPRDGFGRRLIILPGT